MQKIISWNVASVRARMPVLADLLRTERPDVVLLQEIKATEDTFPFFDFRIEGYSAVISGQKGYNGVAILSRTALKQVQTELPGFEDQARFIQAETGSGTVLICVYVPNGNPPEKNPEDKSRLEYKLRWMNALKKRIENLVQEGRQVILGGDFNVIERDTDVYNPDLFRGGALMADSVKNAYSQVTFGLENMIRKFNPEPQTYSFWDFQGGAWPQNKGILLDAIWVTPGLAKKCQSAVIYQKIRDQKGTSDHAPVGMMLSTE